ncbi:uncharacterized protein [Eurosta solidaginis]|uniref:uncharacterized protein n=1 Tax=Eurosta solidaginis TaxID=178769 RepID=UPI00353064AE
MEVFESWPEYKLPSGYRHIEIDFTVLFPAASSILNTWDQQKLYTVLISEGHLNNKTIKDMLSDIENLNKTSQEACLLWALHGCLVPWQKIIRKGVDGKKQVTRFTIKDSQNAFVMICPSIEALEESIRVLTEEKTLIQPFIIIIGKDIKNVNEIFFYFDVHTVYEH